MDEKKCDSFEFEGIETSYKFIYLIIEIESLEKIIF